MTVRAKFKCIGYDSRSSARDTGEKDAAGNRIYEAVELRTVHLQPVYGNGDPEHENTKFWQASPSGRIELGTVNPDGWKHFERDREYYVDFTPAD